MRRAELDDRLSWYLDPEAPEKPNIDWSEAEARAEHTFGARSPDVHA